MNPVMVKRIGDVALAIAGLLIASPVLVVTAAAIRVTMGSPVLFRQVRPGLGGKPFTLWKFRTMRPALDPADETRYGDRLTRLGGWLRRTSIDELPQLFNVIRGDLSLVGPRPLLMEYLPLYDERQARRHEVPPGITGWAQVNGRDSISMERRFEYDVWYVDNWSLRLDAQIMWRTVRYVASGSGVGRDGAPLEPDWEGNKTTAFVDGTDLLEATEGISGRDRRYEEAD